MIQKVNRPPLLSLVGQSKAPDNNPGESSGSGNFYEGPGSKPSSGDPKNDTQANETNDENENEPKLTLVHSVEQSGMTDVVKDLLDLKNHDQPTQTKAGLATRYSSDSSTAKGLLLNKKAE